MLPLMPQRDHADTVWKYPIEYVIWKPLKIRPTQVLRI